MAHGPVHAMPQILLMAPPQGQAVFLLLHYKYRIVLNCHRVLGMLKVTGGLAAAGGMCGMQEPKQHGM